MVPMVSELAGFACVWNRDFEQSTFGYFVAFVVALVAVALLFLSPAVKGGGVRELF